MDEEGFRTGEQAEWQTLNESELLRKQFVTEGDHVWKNEMPLIRDGDYRMWKMSKTIDERSVIVHQNGLEDISRSYS